MEAQRPRAPFEARLDPPPRSRVPWIPLSVGAAALGGTLWMPAEVGLAVVLPLLFAWLGLRAAWRSPAPAGRTVRFLPEALEIEGHDFVARTAWRQIVRAERNSAQLVIHMPSGGLAMPVAQLAGGLDPVIDALPSHVRVETIEDPPARATPTAARRTLALWLLLFVLLVVIYVLAGGDR
jgi:hypothetical protein